MKGKPPRTPGSRFSFPRSVWERKLATLCVAAPHGTGRRASGRAFPRSAWERGATECAKSLGRVSGGLELYR